MKREVLNFTEYEIKPIIDEYALEQDEYWDQETDNINEGPWNDFEIIETSVSYTDLEKAYEDRRVIVKRLSDGKFFEGSFTFSYHTNYYNTTLTEVFSREVTVTIYG